MKDVLTVGPDGMAKIAINAAVSGAWASDDSTGNGEEGRVLASGS